MRALILFLAVLLAQPGEGIGAPRTEGAGWLAQGPAGQGNPPRQGIAGQVDGPQVSSQQAASRVKRAYSDHKILSIRLIDGQGPPVYRVKTLSDDGVVKYVFVDGVSGDVFE